MWGSRKGAGYAQQSILSANSRGRQVRFFLLRRKDGTDGLGLLGLSELQAFIQGQLGISRGPPGYLRGKGGVNAGPFGDQGRQMGGGSWVVRSGAGGAGSGSGRVDLGRVQLPASSSWGRGWQWQWPSGTNVQSSGSGAGRGFGSGRRPQMGAIELDPRLGMDCRLGPERVLLWAATGWSLGRGKPEWAQRELREPDPGRGRALRLLPGQPECPVKARSRLFASQSPYRGAFRRLPTQQTVLSAADLRRLGIDLNSASWRSQVGLLPIPALPLPLYPDGGGPVRLLLLVLRPLPTPHPERQRAPFPFHLSWARAREAIV